MLVIEQVNRLAKIIYHCNGYVVPDGYDFSGATHPQEQNCWNAACLIWEELFGDSPDLYADWMPCGEETYKTGDITNEG